MGGSSPHASGAVAPAPGADGCLLVGASVFWCGVVRQADATYSDVAGKLSTTAANAAYAGQWYIAINTATGQLDIKIHHGASGVVTYNTSLAVEYGRPLAILLRAAETKILVDTTIGSEVISAAVATTAGGAVAPRLNIGANDTGFSAHRYTATVLLAAANSLLPVEVVQNPWMLFEPRRVWVPVSASGGGGGDATAPGVTQSAQASLLAAAAAAASAAAGATVTAAASLLAGAAQAASAAAGITSTTTATLLPGLASGTGDASAPGAVLAFGAALQAGLPNAGAAAAGRTLALTSSLIAGAAGGAAGAMAPGAVLQLQAQLLAGGVAVDAAALGAVLGMAAQLLAGDAEGDTEQLPMRPSAPPRLTRLAGAARAPRIQAARRAPRTQPRTR